jgi:hypothetical protein
MAKGLEDWERHVMAAPNEELLAFAEAEYLGMRTAPDADWKRLYQRR